ncbi:hypothetical protein M8C21_010788 [Ambrosia artemisiifolia]|uniref:Uncharacterized protein n=1 Tax=Ambrosia artemisiifolia TaxID=4212 RepID=A0AAD5GAI6_AMBAR|nr:hypothetical protein M8C21_010788 [Ambrosia artemisiifolia]
MISMESCFDTFHIQKASWLNTIGRYRHHVKLQVGTALGVK